MDNNFGTRENYLRLQFFILDNFLEAKSSDVVEEIGGVPNSVYMKCIGVDEYQKTMYL